MLLLASTFRQNHVFRTLRYEGIRNLNPLVHRQQGSCCVPTSSKGSQKGNHQIKYKPYVPPCYRDHDHKNMTLRRPMSPHLDIYTMTMPATTSILQRISGIILTSYALLLAGGTLFLSNGIETYVSIIQSLNLSRSTTFLIKIILGAPFAFHYFNGIRFVAWSAGRWLAMKDVKDSAVKSWIAAAAMIFFFALL